MTKQLEDNYIEFPLFEYPFEFSVPEFSVRNRKSSFIDLFSDSLGIPEVKVI